MEDNSYSQLIEESIKLHFERNGALDEMRSGLHAKVLTMLHEQKKLRKDEPLCGGDLEKRGLSHLLNQLIVDYFDWYGYKHTLETFSLETGIRFNRSREKLRRELKGNFDHKELPILLDMLMQQTIREPSKKSEEEPKKPSPSVAKMNNKPSSLIKVQGPNLIAKQLRQAELKSQRISSRGNINAAVESPVKANKTNGANTAPAKSINRNVQGKVNVRQRMADVDGKVPNNPKNAAKKASGNSKNICYSDTGSDPSKSSTEDEIDETESSETFADIPNRYYYREQEPPEKSYAHGYGEEGPYEGPQQRHSKPLHARKMEKSKTIKIIEMDNKEKKPKAMAKDTLKATSTNKPKVSEHCAGNKRSKFLYNPHRRLNHSDDDLNMPVSKPKCPDTVISSIKMDSGDDTEDDSDVYL